MYLIEDSLAVKINTRIMKGIVLMNKKVLNIPLVRDFLIITMLNGVSKVKMYDLD